MQPNCFSLFRTFSYRRFYGILVKKAMLGLGREMVRRKHRPFRSNLHQNPLALPQNTLRLEFGHCRTLKHFSRPSYRKSLTGITYGVDIAPRKRGLYQNIQYKPQIDTYLLHQPRNFNCHLNPYLRCRPIQSNVIKEQHT